MCSHIYLTAYIEKLSCLPARYRRRHSVQIPGADDEIITDAFEVLGCQRVAELEVEPFHQRVHGNVQLRPRQTKIR